jgi:hypothetical protein
MSTMSLNHTRTWSYFSSLWSALKEWQRRAVSRRLERTAADIEASNVFWRDHLDQIEIERLKLNHRKAVMRRMALHEAGALKI